MGWTNNLSRSGGPAHRAAALVALAFLLAGCGFLGGSPDVATDGATRVAGAAVTPTDVGSAQPTVIPLNNENWDLAVQDADRYRGSPVDITGQIFYAIGDYEGASHYQLFTDPRARTGNTHLALPLGLPKLGEGDTVHVAGTLERMLVVSSRSGSDLRIPYVAATSLEILAGPSGPQVILAPPEPTAEPTPSPTETPPSPTPAPPTETPPPSSPTATETAQVTPTVALSPTAPPATASPVLTPMPSPTVGSFQADFPATSFAPTSELLATADPGAPAGLYYSSANSSREWNRNPPVPADAGAATVSFEVPKSGRYAVWIRMHYQHVDANSLWLVVDDRRVFLFGNEDRGYGVWKWVGWHDGNPGARLTVELAAGSHAITVASREAGTRFDALLITSDLNFKPSDPSPSEAGGTTSQSPPAPSATALSSTAVTPTPAPGAATQLPSPSPSPAGHAFLASVTPTVPPSTPTAAAGTATAEAPSGSYTVQPGDTLSAIAGRFYGDPAQYRRIFDANRDQLSSPDRINPGMQLRIPR